MKWLKKGLIYAPDGSVRWARKYAYPASPLLMNDSTLRIYLAFCDDNMVGRAGYVDLDVDNPSVIRGVSSEPVLDIGAPGAFDENGVVPTSVIRVGELIYMYYVGYQLGYKVRYFQFQGLAISADGGNSFTRYSRVPVLDRSDRELLNRASAFVMHDDGIFRMWYVGGSEWITAHGKTLPTYNMRYLESADGKNWGKEGRVCLDFQNDNEHALGRPWVIRQRNSFRMFYSVRTRSSGYRLGYAESADGVGWQRKDAEVGIDVSASGWDSQMTAYSAIYRHNDRTYLFYNGNNCGETGFGYAVLDEPRAGDVQGCLS
jgi:predicted GH43/DUF377 family glycosyl hydrolase